MVYTLQERIELVFIYGTENNCARRTANTFNTRHPEKNVSRTYVRQLIAKFNETGSVANEKRTNYRVLNELTQIEILHKFQDSPTTSLRNVSNDTGVSLGSVHKVMKLNKFHPYKIKILHELYEDDFDRRIEFCERMVEIEAANGDQIKNICFSDECTFFINGFVNKHNCRYWSNNNPHEFVEGATQRPEKVNVWDGILGDRVIGPLFIERNKEGNLNGEIYLDMLETQIAPLIEEAIETQEDEDGNPNLDPNLIYFQQDGAPPHYTLAVRQWLNGRFANRWIGRRGTIEWPARSPDLTPLDFFLWGHLKSVIYKTQPLNLEDLKNRIRRECAEIPRNTFRKVRSEFSNRLYHCLATNGQHFEQLL